MASDPVVHSDDGNVNSGSVLGEWDHTHLQELSEQVITSDKNISLWPWVRAENFQMVKGT